MIANEIALAVRLRLGIARPGELSELVDRRIAAVTRVDGLLLELATPGGMAAEDVAQRLEQLSGLPADRIARMQVILTDALVHDGRVTLDRALAFLEHQVAHALPPPVAQDVDALADTLWFVRSGTHGTERDAKTALRKLADRCAQG